MFSIRCAPLFFLVSGWASFIIILVGWASFIIILGVNVGALCFCIK